MTSCNRCGQCCIIHWKGKDYRCPHLILLYRLNKGSTLCRIYNDPKRIGKIIKKIDGKIFKCTQREKSEYDYPGCPYNTNLPFI